jgi:hypothetical protein
MLIERLHQYGKYFAIYPPSLGKRAEGPCLAACLTDRQVMKRQAMVTISSQTGG